MKNTTTTAVTVIALALGGFSAQPVGAGDDSRDLAKFLLFSSLLVAIAADRNNKDRPPAEAHPKPRRQTHVHAPPAHPPAPRYRPRRHVCLEDFWNGRRWVTFRDHECRRHNANGRGFRGVNRCLREEFRRGRWVSTFDRHCMERKGFTLARRH